MLSSAAGAPFFFLSSLVNTRVKGICGRGARQRGWWAPGSCHCKLPPGGTVGPPSGWRRHVRSSTAANLQTALKERAAALRCSPPRPAPLPLPATWRRQRPAAWAGWRRRPAAARCGGGGGQGASVVSWARPRRECLAALSTVLAAHQPQGKPAAGWETQGRLLPRRFPGRAPASPTHPTAATPLLAAPRPWPAQLT